MRDALLAVLVAAVLLSAACGDESGSDEEVLHPDVLKVSVDSEPGGTYVVVATLSSPYDTPERYADAWRVLAPEGTVLGIRELAHDHQAEQPFTRSLSGVAIPADVTEVIVEGRDQVSGWGGQTARAAVPSAAS